MKLNFGSISKINIAELDAQLGEINMEIISHENRIIERLSGYVLTYSRNIYEPLRVIGLIDW